MERPDAQPIMTLTIATNDGWDAVRPVYAAARKQTDGQNIEVIVIDDSGELGPDASELSEATRIIEMPGADISEMRMRGYREAHGNIVAMIEDHVIVSPDWIDTMLAVHEQHPEAIAVGGAVKNG